MPENFITVEEHLKQRTLFWFAKILHMTDQELRNCVDQYNIGALPDPARWALEAIEEMSG